MSTAIEKLLAAQMEFGRLICEQIRSNIDKLELTDTQSVVAPSFSSAEFTLVTDPYTQQQNLVGYWFNPKRQRTGQIQFNSDGSCYAEYDIVQNHPRRPDLFIEAISVWGHIDNLKSEARLLELPGSEES